MDEIRELASRVDSLDAGELCRLADLINAKAAEIADDDETDEATALLAELADITDRVASCRGGELSTARMLGAALAANADGRTEADTAARIAAALEAVA